MRREAHQHTHQDFCKPLVLQRGVRAHGDVGAIVALQGLAEDDAAQGEDDGEEEMHCDQYMARSSATSAPATTISTSAMSIMMFWAPNCCCGAG